jgi:hypothetical protein
MLNNFEAGKLGEHICMTRLMKLGYSCQIVNLDTVDIIINYEETLLRVQVKSSVLKGRGGAAKNHMGYQFATSHSGKKRPLTREQCDIVALVAIEPERVLFKPVECLKGQVTKRISPTKFNKDDLEQRSLQHCLDAIFLSN